MQYCVNLRYRILTLSTWASFSNIHPESYSSSDHAFDRRGCFICTWTCSRLDLDSTLFVSRIFLPPHASPPLCMDSLTLFSASSRSFSWSLIERKTFSKVSKILLYWNSYASMSCKLHWILATSNRFITSSFLNLFFCSCMELISVCNFFVGVRLCVCVCVRSVRCRIEYVCSNTIVSCDGSTPRLFLVIHFCGFLSESENEIVAVRYHRNPECYNKKLLELKSHHEQFQHFKAFRTYRKLQDLEDPLRAWSMRLWTVELTNMTFKSSLLSNLLQQRLIMDLSNLRWLVI